MGATETSYGDDSFRSIGTDELTQNELQNTIETLWAQVFKNKILPAVSVSEADWDEWSRARALSRWLQGTFEDGKVYSKVIPQVGYHCLTYGTGFIRADWRKLDKNTAQIYHYPVNPKNVLVDRIEAKHGLPRNIYIKDHVDRWVLHAIYGEEDKDFFGTVEERCKGIEDCSADDDPEIGSTQISKSDMLTVREAWHLPSSSEAKDGRHCIWIRGCTLLDEPFSWDRFPIAKIQFGQPLEGFYGESAVRRLAPTQKNLDKLNKKIDEAQDVMGVPRVIIGRQGNNLKPEHFDDVPGTVLVVDDINQVRDWNAQCATPELYNDRDNAKNKMLGLMGISSFEADQQIPQGMRDVSGVMLERWIDAGPARHAMFHSNAEELITDLSEIDIRLAEELQDAGYNVVAKAPADGSVKSFIEKLNFKDVCLDRKRLKLWVQPMSNLPKTFAGKVDAIEKMNKARGLPLSPKAVDRMLEVPDPEGTTDILVSSEEIIFKNLTWMTKRKRYIQPLPFDDLDGIVRMTTDYINWYRIREDADNEVIYLLAKYIDDALALKRGPGNDPNAPPPPSTLAAMGGVGPMGAPGMPPQPGMPPMGPEMVGPMGAGVAPPPGPMQAPMPGMTAPGVPFSPEGVMPSGPMGPMT